jgi:glycosyltransferase involved in cell wall biosynthesis
MLFRKPIVCCYADGSERDLVENYRNGFVIDEAADIRKELAARMLTILNDADLRQAMGEESLKKYFEVASFEKLMQNIEGLIAQTLSGK